MKTPVQHLSCGALVALAKTKATGDKVGKSMHHLNTCAECARNFAAVAKRLNTSPSELNDRVSNFFKTAHCSEEDSDNDKAASVFVSFLNPEPSESGSLTLLAHLNKCYPCFEMFVRNWNDYLNT
jgi:hypothetical protein